MSVDRQRATQLFPIAKTYPQFFKTNLVDPGRVLKRVEGRNSAIRVFYYQLLKLIFQLDTNNDDGTQIDYPNILANIITKLINKSNNQSLKLYANQIQNFINTMLTDGQVQFQSILQQNLQIDTAFVAIFQELLRVNNVDIMQVEEVFNCLCGLFQIRLGQADKCIKFQESDVFVYLENYDLLYMAFLNLEENQNADYSIDNTLSTKPTHNQFSNQNTNQSSSQNQYSNQNQHYSNQYPTSAQNQPVPPPRPSSTSPPPLDPSSIYTSTNLQQRVRKPSKANDTIINIFGDMLHSSKHEGDSKYSNSILTNNNNNLNSSLSPAKRDQEVLTSLKGGNQLLSGSYHYGGAYQGASGSGQEGKSGSGEEGKSGSGEIGNRVGAGIVSQRQEYNFQKLIRAQPQPKLSHTQSRQSQVQKYQAIPNSYTRKPNPSYQSNSSYQPFQPPLQNQHQPQPDLQPLIYRPQRLPTTLQSISQVTASKQSLLYSKYNNTNKKDPFDLVDDQEKGTFYRMFTNTRILSILPEPHRTNVKVLKSRFIGIHGKDFKK